jgi:hypothetical protein
MSEFLNLETLELEIECLTAEMLELEATQKTHEVNSPMYMACGMGFAIVEFTRNTFQRMLDNQRNDENDLSKERV